VSHPRRILPGETYLVTRRCYQRTFRLRPSAETNRIFLYCLAFAAERAGVRIHAVCVMSNHHHAVITDVRGTLPIFLRELHRLTAKALNACQGEWENLWAAEPCNVVRLMTDEDIDDKIAYVVANPVSAGLVMEPEEWPGVLLWGERTLRVSRPHSYFQEHGDCAPELTLRVERPLARDAASPATGWRDRVAEQIRTKAAEARRKVRKAGHVFLGRAAVLAASFRSRAKANESRFGVIPTFAARDSGVRQLLARAERHFRARYRRALERWRAGRREEAVFPAGTWAMAVFHSAVVQLS
jgi:REP element-mobilizing transposase RayT